MANLHALLASIDERQNAVVGSDEIMALTAGNDGAARGADAGVHDDEVNRAGREIGIRLGNGQGAIEDVESLHRVADVNDFGLGNDTQNDAFDGADEMVAQPEVGSQGDDGTLLQDKSSL